MLDWTAIITGFVAAISTWVATYFSTKKSKDEVDSNNQTSMFRDLMADCNAIRGTLIESLENNLKMQQEFNDLRGEFEKLKLRLEDYERNTVSHDAKTIIEVLVQAINYPVWLCDCVNNRWYLNDAYCKQFNIKRTGFWTPVNIVEFYDPSLAEQFINENMKSLRVGSPTYSLEKMRKNLMLPVSSSNEEQFWHIVKVPVSLNVNSKWVVGVASNTKIAPVLFGMK